MWRHPLLIYVRKGKICESFQNGFLFSVLDSTIDDKVPTPSPFTATESVTTHHGFGALCLPAIANCRGVYACGNGVVVTRSPLY